MKTLIFTLLMIGSFASHAVADLDKYNVYKPVAHCSGQDNAKLSLQSAVALSASTNGYGVQSTPTFKGDPSSTLIAN